MKLNFLTDNPFRLMGIRSGITQAELRRKSKEVAARAKVGLAPSVALPELEATGVEHLDSITRALATAPKKRTCYRLMWPLGEWGLAVLYGNDTAELSHDRFEEIQLSFVEDWISFVRSKSPNHLQSALYHWNEFYNCGDSDGVLRSLLETEEGIDSDAALEIVMDAQHEVAVSVMSSAASIAADMVRNADERGFSLVSAILDSPIEDEFEEMALAPVLAYGNELAATLRTATEELDKWFPIWADPINRETGVLKRLVGLIGDRHPQASEWRRQLWDWADCVALAMRSYAIDAHNDRDDQEGARTVLKNALNLNPGREVQQRILKDLSTIEENIAAGSLTTRSGRSRGTAQTSAASPPSASLPSVNWGCLFWIAVLAIGGLSQCDNNSGTTAASETQQTDQSSSARNASDTERRAAKLRAVESELERVQARISELQTWLDTETQRLGSESQYLDGEYSTLDGYQVIRSDLIDEHNARVRRYNNRLKEFNIDVAYLKRREAELGGQQARAGNLIQEQRELGSG